MEPQPGRARQLAFLALTPLNVLGGPAVVAVLAGGVLVALSAGYAAITSRGGGARWLATCELVLALLPGGLTVVYVMTSKAGPVRATPCAADGL